jgi:hypothetical protein
VILIFFLNFIAGKICLLELQIPCCGVLLAGPSFERETEGSGNNEYETLYSRLSNFLSMDITPSDSFTRHELSTLLGTPLVDVLMENALAGVRDMVVPLVAPRDLSVVTSEYLESAVV